MQWYQLFHAAMGKKILALNPGSKLPGRQPPDAQGTCSLGLSLRYHSPISLAASKSIPFRSRAVPMVS